MTEPLKHAARIAEIHRITAERFVGEIFPSYRPVILRGLVADWPAGAAGRKAPGDGGLYSYFDTGWPAKAFAAGRRLTAASSIPAIIAG